MTEFISPEQANTLLTDREKEIEERIYEVCDSTRNILQRSIESAIRDCKRDVYLVTRGYEIDEGGGLIQKFLEQEGYQNVIVEEKGYSCFDNNRGQTQIIFSF